MTDISVSGNSPPSVSVSGSTVSVSVSSGVGPQGPAGKDGGAGVASLNGLTGTLTIASAGGVTASGATLTIGGGGASSWDDLTGKPNLVYSVAGRTGTVTLTTADIGGLGSLATKSSLGNINSNGAIGIAEGRILVTDADGVIGTSTVGLGLVIEDDSVRPDVPYIKTQLAAVASSGSYVDLTNKPTIPVLSVAGRTGDITLTTADVSGYTAPPVTSVAGRTGSVTLSTSDVTGFSAAASSAAPVQSVAGRTGAVTLAGSDINVATTTALGVVQVGAGLTATAGVLATYVITSSSSAPTGGSSGDIHLRYTP